MRNFLKGKTHTVLLIVRIIVGIIFVAHGLDKFNMGMDAVAGFFESINIPAPMLMAWLVTLIETFGGIALIIGFGTELAAGLLVLVMIGALITIKFSTELIGGYELDLALIAALLPILSEGAGKYSLSHFLKMMKPAAPQATY